MNGKVRWVQRMVRTQEEVNAGLPKAFHRRVLQAFDEGSGHWIDVPLAQEEDDGIDARVGAGGERAN